MTVLSSFENLWCGSFLFELFSVWATSQLIESIILFISLTSQKNNDYGPRNILLFFPSICRTSIGANSMFHNFFELEILHLLPMFSVTSYSGFFQSPTFRSSINCMQEKYQHV